MNDSLHSLQLDIANN